VWSREAVEKWEGDGARGEHVIAWIALGVSIGALTLGIFQWITGRRRNRVLGDPEVARTAIVNARDRFQEIVDVGGEDRAFFQNEGHRSISQALRDVSARRQDLHLNELLESIAFQWEWACDHAPAPLGPRFISLASTFAGNESPEDSERERRKALEVEAAQKGMGLCAVTLDRLNWLEQTL
jgi:hypothetical protein